jgi:hypothetical protein
VAIPLLTENSIRFFNLFYVWSILAGLSFLTIAAGATYKPRSTCTTTQPECNQSKLKNKVHDYFGLDVFKNKEFLVWTFASFIGILGNLIPIITMVCMIFSACKNLRSMRGKECFQLNLIAFLFQEPFFFITLSE